MSCVSTDNADRAEHAGEHGGEYTQDWWPTPGVEETKKCGCSFTRLGLGWLHTKCSLHAFD